MSGRVLNLLPDPLAEVGVGAGVAVGASGLLGVVCGPAVDLVRADLFGTVPNVEAVGEEGVVLGVDYADAKDDDGWVALVEVLAFGGLTLGSGAGGSGLDLAAVVTLACVDGACSRMNSAVPSAVVTVYQLNLNSGTVWFSS